MPKKFVLDKMSIYIPEKRQAEKLVERLIKLAEKKDRSLNYLTVEAIAEYLERHEKER
jgi:predicted transcriptional regulator